MSRISAMPITPTGKQEGILKELSNSRTVGTSLVIRSKIVLVASSKNSNNQIERELKRGKNTVIRYEPPHYP